MPDFLIPLKLEEQTADGFCSARADVPENSSWFDGHFPDEPILPGIAILDLVHRMICECARQRGHNWELVQMDRIRFRQILRPKDRIALEATIDFSDPGALQRFEVSMMDETICRGMMKFVEILE